MERVRSHAFIHQILIKIKLTKSFSGFAAGTQQRPQGHIIVRGQVPPNQMQWIQQQQQVNFVYHIHSREQHVRYLSD